MNRAKSVVLTLALGVALGATALRLDRRAEAQDMLVPGAPEMLQTAADFAEGLSLADRDKVLAVSSSALWARLEASFDTSPPPQAGDFGQLEGLQVGAFVNASFAQTQLLLRHRDGVEDVVTITLKRVGGEWRVCGGPAATTALSPLTPR